MKQDGPTNWEHSLVIAQKKKDDSLRLCLDPQSLNASICQDHIQIPTFKDISAGLIGKKLFSMSDQKDSYWKIRLGHDSSRLYTFNTPLGCYRCPKIPFDISSVTEAQQRKTYQVYGDIEGVHVILYNECKFRCQCCLCLDEKSHFNNDNFDFPIWGT